MHKNKVYSLKNIYLGLVEVFDYDETLEKVIAFHQILDAQTSNKIYEPLNEDVGYYYIKKLEPIRRCLNLNEMSGILTLDKIRKIVLRESQKENKGIFAKENKKEIPTEISPIIEKNYESTKPVTDNQECIYPQKVMTYRASRDRAA